MKLNLKYDAISSEFTLTIYNSSGGSANETPFSPGVWAVSNILGEKLLNISPFYEAGESSNPQITAIAEMGNNKPLKDKVSANTGIITSLSPVLIVVYHGNVNPVFNQNIPDSGHGLKELAQHGDGTALKAYLEKLPQVKRVYIAGDRPIGPNEKVTTEIVSNSGDQLVLVTMFGYSNDWFYGNEVALSANTIGNITSKMALFDSGTAVDQYPGAGNHQALFGGSSPVENKSIVKVNMNFPIPEINKILKVTYQ